MVNETPQADFFYACPAHVSDPGFAILTAESQKHIADQAAKQKEIEQLKTEWQAVQAKKSNSSADTETTSTENTKTDTTRTDPSQPDVVKPNTAESIPPAPSPARRVYELNRGVFNLRLNAKRRTAQERKTQAMLNNPDLFPTVPRHKPK